MTGLFVDTAGWMACADASDPVHAASRTARDQALRAGQILVTSDYIVDETLTLLRVHLGARAAGSWWRQIDGSTRLRWERIDVARFERAIAFFLRHADKSFSFTDCTSFVLMKELKLDRALTTDEHFRQAGFAMVPSLRRPRRPLG